MAGSSTSTTPRATACRTTCASKGKSKGKGGLDGFYSLRPGPMPLLINGFKIAPYRRHYFTEGYGGPCEDGLLRCFD